MSEELEYNPDLYTLVDEEGVEQTFELLDVMEVDDDRYFALIPYYENPEDLLDDTAELIVLKSQLDENGEEVVPCSYEGAAPYPGGAWLKSDGQWGLYLLA